jgi:hypothetical protein
MRVLTQRLLLLIAGPLIIEPRSRAYMFETCVRISRVAKLELAP